MGGGGGLAAGAESHKLILEKGAVEIDKLDRKGHLKKIIYLRGSARGWNEAVPPYGGEGLKPARAPFSGDLVSGVGGENRF